MLGPDIRLQRSPELIAAPLGDELAMMDPDNGTYFLLDEVAAVVWEQLSEPTDVRDVCAALQARFDVSPDQCEQDVLPFLQHLLDKGLVRDVA